MHLIVAKTLKRDLEDHLYIYTKPTVGVKNYLVGNLHVPYSFEKVFLGVVIKTPPNLFQGPSYME